MKMKFPILILLFLLSCSKNETTSFIYNGRLESDTVRLSARIAGTVDSLFVDEGDRIVSGQILARINDERFRAQKKQQSAQIVEIELTLEGLNAQIRQIESQLTLASETLIKTEVLLRSGAATEQSRDEVNTRVNVFQAQLDALMTNKKIAANKSKQLRAGMEITEINLRDAIIRSPLDGLIINSFHKEAEVVGTGMPIFDAADLTQMEATIYVPLNDLNRIKIGQKTRVKVDGIDFDLEGSIKWIGSEAEFTPKTILTKETRTTLVYAVKVNVPNPEEKLKIGMPVDIEL